MKKPLKTAMIIVAVLTLTSITNQTTGDKGQAERAEQAEPKAKPQQEVAEAMPPTEEKYIAEELDLLARIINAEAGVMSDEAQQLVGNVVLNRVEDARFPDTIKDVIYQKGQYSPTWNGAIKKEPTERAINNAKRLLDGERFCDKNVVWQAEFKQGKGVYKKTAETVNGYTYTMYFCY